MSYLENARAFGRSLTLVIADGSSDSSTCGEYREIGRELARRFDCRVEYCGPRERADFVRHLAQDSGVEPQLVEFALLDPFGVNYRPGANRNALMLHTAGSPVFTADDDTFCRVAGAAAGDSSLRISDLRDPTNIWPFESRDGLEQSVRFTDVDLIGLHEKCLGSDIGSLLGRVSDVEVFVSDPVFIGRVANNQPRILVSWTGIAGDSGYTRPGYLLGLQDDARAHFLRDEASCRRMLASRQILRSPSRLTVTPGGYCQSTALAFDNRAPLPPFCPVFRGEDIIFSDILRLFFPAAATAYLPASVMHDPEPDSAHSPVALAEAAAGLSPVTLIRAAIDIAGESAGRDGLRSASQVLARARQVIEREEFEALATVQMRIENAVVARNCLAELAGGTRLPQYWRSELGLISRNHERAALGVGFDCPPEIVETRPLGDQFRVLQSILASYFKLVETWPSLISSARTLRDRGTSRLAREVD